jgi:hypothetical protein
VKPLGVGDLHCRESTRPFEDILCSLPRRILTRKANSNGWLMAGEPTTRRLWFRWQRAADRTERT